MTKVGKLSKINVAKKVLKKVTSRSKPQSDSIIYSSKNDSKIAQKVSIKSKKVYVLSANDWVAISEKGSDWYVGKIDTVEEASDEKKYFL